MKIGIISDVHANLPALQAVLAALEECGVERVFCGGDIVGYGPCPRECIQLIRERGIPCVKGNHDEYVTQPDGDWRIQPEARTVIQWTQQVLEAEELAWLAALPMAVEIDGATVIHASHTPAPRWRYVVDERTALENFLFQESNVTFNGHTHVPLCAVHQRGRHPKVTLLRSMFLPRNARVLIGVGSVGQPRDGDARACCVFYDSDQRLVRVLRVGYDIRAVQEQIRAAGLPEELARRLQKGR